MSAHVLVQIIRGDRDTVIPVSHTQLAHAAMPGPRLDVFRGSGHFPSTTIQPDSCRSSTTSSSTPPVAVFDAAHWRSTLISGTTETLTTSDSRMRNADLDAVTSDAGTAT